MTRRDGDLRHTFRVHLPQAQWSSIETGATEGGVPDSEYCFPDGTQGWIEFKCARRGWGVVIRPAQAAWISRRARHGGRVHIAVLREDVLHLLAGSQVRALQQHGLRDHTRWWGGGPRMWPWQLIEDILRNERSSPQWTELTLLRDKMRAE
jgi:hypothetical protein